MATAEKVERKQDSELLVLARVCRALDALSEADRGRVVAYLASRYLPSMMRAYPIHSDSGDVKLSHG